MTTSEFIKKQEAKINEIIKNNKPLLMAVSSVVAMQSKRIFIEGKNADGGIIGEYKGGGIYVSPNANKDLKSFPLTGKDGISENKKIYSIKTKKALKNKSSHRTGYFENYLAFKKAIGKNKLIQTVDLNLTGELHRHWANGDIANPGAQKINQHNYIVSITKEDQDKVDKYDRVFNLSKKERETFLKVVKIELNKAFK